MPRAPVPVPSPPPVGAVRVRLVNEEWSPTCAAPPSWTSSRPSSRPPSSPARPRPLRAGELGHDTAHSLAKLARTDRPVAELLMDQSVLAGVGNVSLRAAVEAPDRPFTPGRKVKKRTWQTIWDDLVDPMPIGVAFGQIITLDEQVAEAKAFLAQRAEAGDAAYLVDWQGGTEGERGSGARRTTATRL